MFSVMGALPLNWFLTFSMSPQKGKENLENVSERK